MEGSRRRALAVASVLAVALLLGLPGAAHGPRPTTSRPLARGGAPLPAPTLAAPLLPAGETPPAPRTVPHPASGPPNVLVDAPCNGGGNAEVEQAYDAAVGYLYEAWIGCGGIGFARSIDGGFSFQPALTVPGSDQPNGSSWDPAIALAPNGTVYVAFMTSVPGDVPDVAWSWNHGESFAGYAAVFTPPANEFSDRDFLAVAPNGTLDLTWDFSPNATLDQIGCAPGGSCYFTSGDYNAVLVHSSDGGRTWSRMVPIDPEYPNGGAPAAPLLVEPNGTIDVLYEDYNISGPTHALGLGFNYFSRSFDGGTNWTAPVRVANLSFADTVWWIDGALARDSSGTLYATFDSTNATANTAWVVLSTNGGLTWRSPLRVNPDVDGASHQMVAAAGSGNGSAFIAWMANNSSGSWSTYVAQLTGNGSAWGPVETASAQAGLAGYWTGDTLGISTLAAGVVAVSWSYGVTQDGVTASQVYEAVLGEPLPGAPHITSLVPGAAEVFLTWTAPNGTVAPDAYRIYWHEEIFQFNRTVPGSQLNATVGPLYPFDRYTIAVYAITTAGEGPSSNSVLFDLTVWTRVAGTVTPSTARVAIDGTLVPDPGGQFSLTTSYAPHLVTLTATNYSSAEVPVGAVWNGTAWANATLALAPGTVRGYLNPILANLTWDGVALPVGGNGAFTVSGPANSSHRLNASAPGLLPFSRVVTLRANATEWLNITLRLPNGTLLLAVSPTSAAVVVNGSAVSLDPTGNATVALPPGTYEVEATALHFVAYFENVTILSGKAARLNVTLLPVATNTTGNTSTPSPFAVLAGPWTIAIVVVLLVGIVLLIAFARRRRPAPPPPLAPEALYPRTQEVPATEPIEAPRGEDGAADESLR